MKATNILEVNTTFLTQKKLAERWNVSQGTIINWRNNGNLPFFQVPGSSRVLYPVDGILECEQKNTTAAKEVLPSKRIVVTEFKRKKPVVSAKPKRDWRI